MKILNIGSMNLDMVYQMDHIVQPGETELQRMPYFDISSAMCCAILTRPVFIDPYADARANRQ